jgi:peptidyl-prolyl cis-trans isomerase A (cyclophilin A)/peptidyl-prolyl cis-trans isomerase B (cyclophilin B)
VLAADAPRAAEDQHGRHHPELNPEKAPVSVDNFLKYVKKGQYNGTVFHRVIDGFMIQGGGMDQNLREKPPTRPSRTRPITA